MRWVGLSRETHIHCGANSGSSFGVRFELATCKLVFLHTQYLDWLAAIGDVFCLFVGLWGWTDAEEPTTKGWLRRIRRRSRDCGRNHRLFPALRLVQTHQINGWAKIVKIVRCRIEKLRELYLNSTYSTNDQLSD